MINLRGHHLELLYSYYYFKTENTFYFDSFKKRIIRSALESGHTEEHGQNILYILEKALDPDEKIILIDTIDDICQTCDRKNERECLEIIPGDFSTARADRNLINILKLRTGLMYNSSTILKRIKKHEQYLIYQK